MRELLFHNCPECGRRVLSLSILLRKGSILCRQCQTVLTFSNFTSGGALLVAIMLALAFMKQPLLYMLGGLAAKSLLIIALLLLFLIGPRLVFKLVKM